MSTTTEAAPTKREPEPTPHHDSQEEEYESAEEIEGEYDEDEVEEIEIEEEVEEEEEVEDEEEEEEEDEDGLKKEKPLDDDEDRKNPQFIPKKGYFYEHDDRTKVEEENGEAPEEPINKEEKPKKPADSVNKWSHDKFDESEQAPKSSEELATLYGYDIRSEDQPPRARRRRRYGRGPTKYTRQWEDEEAYQKPRGGFRGRGVGRGNFRGSNRDRRRDSREEYEEDFPELGDSTTKVNKIEPNETKPVSKPAAAAPFPKRSDKEQQQQQPPPQHQAKRGPGGDERINRDNNGPPPRRDVRPSVRDYDRENESYSSRGGRGAGGRGGGNSRRGGRRNEFTNRNRYPNRRDYRDDAEYNETPSNSNTNHSSRQGGGNTNNNRASYNNSYEGGRDRDRDYGGPKPKSESNRRGDQNQSRTIVNGTSNDSRQKPFVNEGKQEKAQHQHQPQQHRIPPFTNTEYPAPGRGGSNVNHRPANNSGPNTSRPVNDRQSSSYSEVVDDRHSREPNEGGEPQKEVRDLREKLNAMRMQKGYQGQNDRRSQIPPRLQQQQQQQQLDPSSKPRRYSTQRERPVVQQQAIVTSGGMVIPNTVAPSIAHGVPNVVPVVTMADGVVPSTVAAYQPPTYYEGTQVYEASASPVTGSGPSVSPSLWTPHASAYATAPYPSPPTAPQVPQAPYGDPTAFIGPGGPAIYAAPPQFLQDPTIINYSGPAPPFPPPYHAHPQGFQGYAQVTPAPPPEVYHGGVTYYSTQNQIQRPPMMAPQKRPKSVLQLVEPPEKSRMDKGPKDSQHLEHQSELVGMNPIPETSSEAELSKKMEEASLEPQETVERKPSPHREFNEETSWAEEMELTSPTSLYPEGNHFGIQKEDIKQPVTEKEVSNEASNSANQAPAAAEVSQDVKASTTTEEKEPVSSTD